MRALGGWVLLLAFAGCISSIDPDKGRYSCATDSGDCGAGYDCVPQAIGGGRCFIAGSCRTETCNGADDNCDGVIDETFSGMDNACTDAGLGLCNFGTLRCIDAGVVCFSPRLPIAEVCNGLDDNCNGSSDETFDFNSDNANCGGCGNVCVAGTTCRFGSCRESNCTDGIDNDSFGGADCLDPACMNAPCFSAPDASYVCGLLVLPDAGTDGGIGDGGTDAGTDAGSDAGTDAGTDAGSDAGSDAGADAGSDAGADAGTDAGSDAGTDAGADAGSDAGIDAGFDGGVDAGFDGGPDSGLDGGPDGGPDAGKDAGIPLGCFPQEVCNDGIDNDRDGLTDCADPFCDGRTCIGGTVCTNAICPGPG